MELLRAWHTPRRTRNIDPIAGSTLYVHAQCPLMVHDLFLTRYQVETGGARLQVFRLIDLPSGTKVEDAHIPVLEMSAQKFLQLSDIVITPKIGLVLEFADNRGYFYGSPHSQESDLSLSVSFESQICPFFEATYTYLEEEEHYDTEIP
ncbi:MAG: hypothetical protein HC921_04855 [Synechococcaceae cyanobacterium SM2_3_1]|nr:hypothetical protein [Synechococcaceae cyanobacterium SM2_3_1]